MWVLLSMLLLLATLLLPLLAGDDADIAVSVDIVAVGFCRS